MPLSERVAPTRRTMTLFFLIDTSGSMLGEKLGAVNEAIEELKPDLQNLADDNPDSEIKITALQFNSGTEWLFPPTPVDSFAWNRLEANGLTDLGAAITELEKKLSRRDDGYMRAVTGSMTPVIILMSDGEPTDDYEGPLDVIKQNKWFTSSIKIAIAIGRDANKSVLQKFTGNIETVIEVRNKQVLKNMIKIVSLRATEFGSKNSRIGSSSGDGATVDSDEAEVLNRALAVVNTIGVDLSDEDDTDEF
ncbi:MAG: VWA domain-containing protein [Clostridiales bacterium]|nr:VWA domain-containing protein [Clostridiales bacterium]